MVGAVCSHFVPAANAETGFLQMLERRRGAIVHGLGETL
jgi:hypothetical protein